ncbi:MAG: hypothetical protein K2M95_07505 [Clostridiales bacterium]|nr:hypothetical protein [Clostridiales bacterium]
MTIGELERYILSKHGVKKKAISEWRYIRYTIYQSLFAAVEEVRGEVYCSLFGKFPDIRTAYPGCVLPAVQLNEEYSSVLLSGKLPDSVLLAMVDAAYEARCALMEKVEISKDGAENAPYGVDIHLIRPKNVLSDEDGKGFEPHTVDFDYDADIARYVDLWRDINNQLSKKEVAATSTQVSVEENAGKEETEENNT